MTGTMGLSVVQMQFMLWGESSDGRWIAARCGKRPEHNLTVPYNNQTCYCSSKNLSIEVVEPLVDVPVEPLLLLLDQLRQLRLRQLPILLLPVFRILLCVFVML